MKKARNWNQLEKDKPKVEPNPSKPTELSRLWQFFIEIGVKTDKVAPHVLNRPFDLCQKVLIDPKCSFGSKILENHLKSGIRIFTGKR